MPSKQTLSNDSSDQVLIEWVGGGDSGRLDILPLNHLKNFDVKVWKATKAEDRETEVAEWREGKKNEAGKWNVYDCKVIAIGRSKDLKKEKGRLELEKETDADGKKHGKDKKEKPKKEEKKSVKEREEKKKKKRPLSDSEDEEKHCKKGKESDSEDEGNTASDSEKPGSSSNSKGDLSEKSDSEEESEDSDMDSDSSDVVPNAACAKKVLQKKSNAKALEKLMKENKKLKKAVLKDVLVKDKNITKKIPIHANSPYYVDPVVYHHTKKVSCSAFVTAMLTQLFPTSVLVVSNIKGGRSKIGGDFHRWALDKNKRKAIAAAAALHFPGTTEPTVNKIISNFINSLRFRLKDPKKKGSAQKLAKYEEKGREKLRDREHVVYSEEEKEDGEENVNS